MCRVPHAGSKTWHPYKPETPECFCPPAAGWNISQFGEATRGCSMSASTHPSIPFSLRTPTKSFPSFPPCPPALSTVPASTWSTSPHVIALPSTYRSLAPGVTHSLQQLLLLEFALAFLDAPLLPGGRPPTWQLRHAHSTAIPEAAGAGAGAGPLPGRGAPLKCCHRGCALSTAPSSPP